MDTGSLHAQQKYFEEAAKRSRADGLAQYEELARSEHARLRDLADDPWVDHAKLDSEPPTINSGDHIKFLIVGAGLGGLTTAVRLLQAGFTTDEIRIVDPAGGAGGTWYWNRFPGLHCDVESYIYLPLLEETGYMPSKKYVSGAEIRRYIGMIISKWGLNRCLALRTTLECLQWCDTARAWRTTLVSCRGSSGQQESVINMDAQFVTLTTGVFPPPQIPKLPGLADFAGPMFHTSRWHFDVTGGSSEDDFPALGKLRNKRVAVLGTGATAVQIVPRLAKYAKELLVFQRTPCAVYERNQRPTDSVQWKAQVTAKPGWQRLRQENFAGHISRQIKDEPNLVGDQWTASDAYWAAIGGGRDRHIAPDKVPEFIEHLLKLDAPGSAKLRARVQQVVENKATADELTPWYPAWCKRPAFSDEYLQAFNAPNVRLVDTGGKGVERVTPDGLVVAGKVYPVDILILSTGYRSPTFKKGDLSAKIGVEIIGRGGRTMTDKFDDLGFASLHGIGSNGFPNLFWPALHQGSATVNFSHVLMVFCEHLAYIMKKAHQDQAGKDRIVLEVTEAAEENWTARIMDMATFFAGLGICTPGYNNGEGETTRPPSTQEGMIKMVRQSLWAAGFVSFTRELEAWRKEGNMDGLQVSAT